MLLSACFSIMYKYFNKNLHIIEKLKKTITFVLVIYHKVIFLKCAVFYMSSK